METYKLFLKNGEQIHTTKANDLIEAIKIFSETKKLNPKDLLNIYNVSKKK